MRSSKWAIAGVVVAGTLLSALPVQACSCGRPEHPCAEWPESTAIFVGRVTDVRVLPTTRARPDGSAVATNDLAVRFAVSETLKGESVTSIEVRTANSTSSCGYPFKRGVTYLVFARAEPATDGPRLSTSWCSSNAEIGRADGSLSYLRKRAVASKTGSLIYGWVQTRTRKSPHERERSQPSAGVRVRAEGPGVPTETLTNANGGFVIEDLGPGRYRVTADLVGAKAVELELTAERCVPAWFYSSDLGTVTGRVVARDHAPLPETLHLLADGWHRQEDLHDERRIEPDGRFEFKSVAAGEYVLALSPLGPGLSSEPWFPTTFHPGVAELSGATRVSVAPGQAVDAGEFVAPAPLSSVEVEGQVVGADGTPVRRATVSAVNEPSLSFATTDGEGRFRLSLPEGAFVHLSAYGPGPEDVFSQEVPLRIARGLSPLRLVLTQGEKEPPPHAEDGIEIVRVTPPDGSQLRAGDEVLIRATVRYQLSTAALATVTLVVQDETGKSVNLPQATSDAVRGSGELTLEARVRVPEKGRALKVFTPLRLPAARRTSIVDDAAYTVAPGTR
jgi:hypothetical protein